MARVSFSSLIAEIVGKLAGSVFQDSYGGFQIRSRVSPRNPQTYFQQLRRGEFGYITQLWRSLSQPQRDTWIAAAPSIGAAFNFFVQSNVNLSLINIAPSPVFISDPAPGNMPIEISSLTTTEFKIFASGFITTVPMDTVLLIFSTSTKEPSKIFTNPSQYSPIKMLPAGSDISSPMDVLSDWESRFGVITAGQRLCVKSALVSTINGSRTDTTPFCSLINIPEMFTRLSTNQTQYNSTGASPQYPMSFTLPANTLVNIGDTMYVEMSGKNNESDGVSVGFFHNEPTPGYNGFQTALPNNATYWVIRITIIKQSTNIGSFSYQLTNSAQYPDNGYTDLFPFDMTVDNDFSAYLISDNSNGVNIRYQIVNIQTL